MLLTMIVEIPQLVSKNVVLTSNHYIWPEALIFAEFPMACHLDFWEALGLSCFSKVKQCLSPSSNMFAKELS